jgi:hypothetical protein
MGLPALKRKRGTADTRKTMTATPSTLQTWATKPLGKVARGAIAVLGMTMATLVLMTSAVVDSGSWALVLLGVALAANSVRAARIPSLARLTAVMATVLAIPLTLQVF